jgi:predicted TIM-barrel fold metal-dependent hydrolase
MNLPFTNAHVHVFNTLCAPDNFLRVVPSNIVRKNSAFIKKMVDSRFGRYLVDKLFNLTNSDNARQLKEWNKYLSFLEVGTEKRQLDIFLRELNDAKTFDSNPRIVGLTLNMDYMDNNPLSKHKRIETQLEEVIEIKRYMPANFFPFLGIDPRFKGGDDLVSWCLPYTESGVSKDGVWYPFFSGLKLYPALGYFPFDPRMAHLYKYAEENGLPVMTHCTRAGSQYIGNDIVSQVSKEPGTIMPDPVANTQAFEKVKANHEKILARIKAYYTNNWVVNSNIGANDLACDLFGHPGNYIPVLESFPKLRICLAHMGGSSEIYSDDALRKADKLDELDKTDGGSWFEMIKAMMIVYPNMYTDISYTLCDLDKPEILSRILEFFNTPDNQNEPLGRRVLFGTDFFMTEQEKSESELYNLAANKLNTWFNQITRVNPANYLKQPL